MIVNTTLTLLDLTGKEEKAGERKGEKRWISGNEIGNEGVKAMSEMHKMNTTLKKLVITCEPETTK